MTGDDDHGGGKATTARDLRLRAEIRARETADRHDAGLTLEETREVLHDLRVHQLELEMQNEELRRAQEALDASRSRYFELYDLAPVGYVTLDPGGMIQEANLRVCRMFGVERSDVVERPLSRFIVPEYQDRHYLHIKQLRETREPQEYQLRMKRADGTELWAWLEATIATSVDEAADVCRVTLSDVTEQHALHESLIRADRMASMGLLAAGVAHEINNPLTFVIYNIERAAQDIPRLGGVLQKLAGALREQVGDDEVRRLAGDDAVFFDPGRLADLAGLAKDAVEGAKRIKEITKGLHSFSRVDKADLAPVDLNHAAQNALKMVNNQIRCRAAVHEDFGQLPPVLATEGKLQQVFLNLLVNAAHAIPEGAVENNRVTVRTWVEGDRVFAEVTDTGSGIAPEDLKNIFEPFFTTKGPDRGTGLGLPITRGIIEDLGGDLQVESAVGRGTRFVLFLPIHRASAASGPAPEAAPTRKRSRILVVDDEVMIRRVVGRILGEDHEIVLADSGRAAREILERDASFDVILCDVMMPDVLGTDLHAWLEESHPRLARRVIFLSGGTFTTRTTDYLRRVSNRLILKPFTAADLIEEVNDRLSDLEPPD